MPVSPYGSGWEELAYLAAVPASASVNTDEPSVIALGGFGIRPDEVDWSGNELTFDGSGDYIAASGYKGITGTSDRTVGAWVKTSSDGVVLSWGNTSNNGQRWVLKIQDGHVCVDVGMSIPHFLNSCNWRV